MKERGIIFSAPMVRALLAGDKTQTRRAVRPADLARAGGEGVEFADQVRSATSNMRCPYGAPGDRLWVRETYSGPLKYEGVPPREWIPGSAIWYWADGEPAAGHWTRPRPGIFMPRWASRIVLEIVAVRIERLNDCSEQDAAAEGWQRCATVRDDSRGHADGALDWYAGLWESINGAGSWDANPWVWVVTFKQVCQGR